MVLEFDTGIGGTSSFFSFRFGRKMENFDFLFPLDPVLPPLPSTESPSEDCLLDPFGVGSGGSTSFGIGLRSTSDFLHRKIENDFFLGNVGVVGFELD